MRFVNTFIDENPLCVCSDEIAAVKKLLSDTDEVKLKQKSSQLVLKITQEKYHISLRASVPHDYPLTQIVSVDRCIVCVCVCLSDTTDNLVFSQ